MNKEMSITPPVDVVEDMELTGSEIVVRALKEMGFTNVRILDIPTNMQTDWYSKDYPFEAGSGAPARQ